MGSRVKFFSGKANAEITADVIEARKHVLVLKLPDLSIIIKKRRQVEFI